MRNPAEEAQLNKLRDKIEGRNQMQFAGGVAAITLVGAVLYVIVNASTPNGPIVVPSAPMDAKSNDSTKVGDAKAPRKDVQWQTTFDGHVIECVIPANGFAYYIVMPTVEEINSGVQPVANPAPSQDSWAMSCGDKP